MNQVNPTFPFSAARLATGHLSLRAGLGSGSGPAARRRA